MKSLRKVFFTISCCDKLLGLNRKVAALYRRVSLRSVGANGSVMGGVAAHLKAANTIWMLRVFVEKCAGIRQCLTIAVWALFGALVTNVGI